MNQPRACCVGCHSEVADGVDVDESALSFFLFGAVNGGVCSAVDYVCDVVVKDEGFHGFGVGQVEFVAIGIDGCSGHFGFKEQTQFVAELTVGAGYKDFHK